MNGPSEVSISLFLFLDVKKAELVKVKRGERRHMLRKRRLESEVK